ncbi:hypothetical protein DUNSADRAFT_492, partial [Dunaliella salina]
SSGIDPTLVGPAVAVPVAVVAVLAAVITVMIRRWQEKQPIQFWSPEDSRPPHELNPQPSPFEPIDRAL